MPGGIQAAMPDPLPRDVNAKSFKQMRDNRCFQDMGVTLVLGDLRGISVTLHHAPDRLPADRENRLGRVLKLGIFNQGRALIQERIFMPNQALRGGETALQSPDGEEFSRNVRPHDFNNFRLSQAVVVSHQQRQPIALFVGLGGPQKSENLVL